MKQVIEIPCKDVCQGASSVSSMCSLRINAFYGLLLTRLRTLLSVEVEKYMRVQAPGDAFEVQFILSCRKLSVARPKKTIENFADRIVRSLLSRDDEKYLLAHF